MHDRNLFFKSSHRMTQLRYYHSVIVIILRALTCSLRCVNETERRKYGSDNIEAVHKMNSI